MLYSYTFTYNVLLLALQKPVFIKSLTIADF